MKLNEIDLRTVYQVHCMEAGGDEKPLECSVAREAALSSHLLQSFIVGLET
jgi:hypothetical protein